MCIYNSNIYTVEREKYIYLQCSTFIKEKEEERCRKEARRQFLLSVCSLLVCQYIQSLLRGDLWCSRLAWGSHFKEVGPSSLEVSYCLRRPYECMYCFSGKDQETMHLETKLLLTTSDVFLSLQGRLFRATFCF